MTSEREFRRTLLVERDLGCHRPVGPDAAKMNGHRLDRISHRVPHGSGFVTAMDHAVGALLIVAGAVCVPVGLFHQLPEGLGITFAEKITRSLPPKHGAGRVAPRSAGVALIAGQEVQKESRLKELPGLAGAATSKNIPE